MLLSKQFREDFLQRGIFDDDVFDSITVESGGQLARNFALENFQPSSRPLQMDDLPEIS
jgi:hypothetical protein